MMLWSERRCVRRAEQIESPVERLRYLRAATAHSQTPNPAHITAVVLLLLAFLLPARGFKPTGRAATSSAESSRAVAGAAKVWLVQVKDKEELYSNGLRIDAPYSQPYHRRRYLLHRESSIRIAEQPAGIVFHSTESHVLPFEAANNRALGRVGRSLVAYVAARHSYHYLVDRFGRVFRTVEEDSSADHAGNSLWTWAGETCLNLNHAFLGVAFEGQTDELLTEAQVRSGAALVEMLRRRYSIPAENCVTHAQVSLNPAQMKIGWHKDWARNFPFVRLGLPDNYQLPVAAVSEFGFTFDEDYLGSAGEGLWVGLHRADSARRASGCSRAELRGRFARYRRQETS